MSGATRALGQKVEGLFTSQRPEWHIRNGRMTVGQVAALCQVTKKTARKYLEMLRDAGVLERCSMWRGNIGEYHAYNLSTARYIDIYLPRDNEE